MRLFKRPAKPRKGQKQYWYARIRTADGKDRWISSKLEVGKCLKAEAEEKIQERIDELKGVLSRRPGSLSANPTFKEAATRFIQKKRIDGKYSWLADFYVFNAMIKYFASIKKVSDFKSEHVERYKRDRKGQIADASINAELKLFRAFFNWLIREGYYVGDNPVAKAGLLKNLPKNERKPFTPDEIKLILMASPPFFQDWINIARWTGMRRIELWQAHISHLNFKERYIFVPASKSVNAREIPLERPALRILVRLAKNADKGFLFLREDGKRYKDPTSISKCFQELCRRAGVENGVFHRLRHTAATKIANRGNLEDAQHILGHKNIQTTMTYVHVGETLRKSVKTLYED